MSFPPPASKYYGFSFYKIFALIFFALILTTLTYAATSIELANGNFINVFGNLSGNNLVNAGNAIDENGELSQNKITINSGDEDDVIEEIEQKTRIGKDKIKKSITFRRKGPSTELLGEPEIAFLQPQLTRIREVNGSVIIKIG